MNALASDVSKYSESQLSYRLIRRRGLTQELIAKIKTAETALGVPFSEAALRLGFVTAEDIQAARAQESAVTPLQHRKLTPNDCLMFVRDPYSAHSEQVRALRTELLLRRNSANQTDCVAILSPSAGEGRSCLSAELAMAFAQLGRPTLLVDADLRHPRQHVLFGAENQQGLSDALAHGTAPALQSVLGIPQLSVLTAGSTHNNPLELLSDTRFERIVDDWRQTYSFVVLDTSAINRYSDGLAVARLIGRVLVLGRAQQTRHRDTRDLLRRLSATQSQILGAVLNHF